MCASEKASSRWTDLKVSRVSQRGGGPARTSAAAAGSPVGGPHREPQQASLPPNPVSSAQGQPPMQLHIYLSDSHSLLLLYHYCLSAPLSAAHLCGGELQAGGQHSWHSHTEGHKGAAVQLKTSGKASDGLQKRYGKVGMKHLVLQEDWG